MIWVNVLTDLAMSMFFWPATFHCMGLDRPETYTAQASPPAACACPDNCACANGVPCLCPPIMPGAVLYQSPNGSGMSYRYPVMPSAPTPTTACCAPPMPCPCPVSSCQSCPTVQGMTCAMPFPVPPPQVQNAYEVQFHLKNGTEAIFRPKFMLYEGSDAACGSTIQNDEGKPCQEMLRVHLGKVEGDCVPVRFQLTQTKASGKPETLQVEQKIHFDTVTGVILGGDNPDPCLAEVVISPVKTAKVKARAELASTAKPIPPAPTYAVPLPPPPTPIGPSGTYCPVAAPATPAPPMPTWAPYQLPLWAPGDIHCTAIIPVPSSPGDAARVPSSPPVMEWIQLPRPIPVMGQQVMPATVPMPMPSSPPFVSLIGAPKVIAIHRASHISVVHEDGKAKLEVTKDGQCSSAVRMKIETDDAGTLCFAAGYHYVHLTGKEWKASADHVDLYDDGRVVLTGHVHVTSEKVGVIASLKGEHVSLNVKHGKVEKISGAMFSK